MTDIFSLKGEMVEKEAGSCGWLQVSLDSTRVDIKLCVLETIVFG